jgi:integrase
MKSPSLTQATGFYLASRRQLGFALKLAGRLLTNFSTYARRVGHRGPLTTALALKWVQRSATRPSRARRLATLRQFATFWATFDPRTQIPPAGLFGPLFQRRPVHIYTAAELADLLAAARPLTPAVPTVLGLLASTGLRSSEALRLQVEDWDAAQALLRVRRSKGGNSRWVPLHPSAAAALQRYGRSRPASASPALFLDEAGQALSYPQLYRHFAALRRQLGWSQTPPPRLHDLRHSFVVRRLGAWYRQGEQRLQEKILVLATYLGHRNVQHTYWYLSGTPELMALGGARLAKALARQRGGPHE